MGDHFGKLTSPLVRKEGPKYMVKLPVSVGEKRDFCVYIEGDKHKVKYPQGGFPGDEIEIFPEGKYTTKVVPTIIEAKREEIEVFPLGKSTAELLPWKIDMNETAGNYPEGIIENFPQGKDTTKPAPTTIEGITSTDSTKKEATGTKANLDSIEDEDRKYFAPLMKNDKEDSYWEGGIDVVRHAFAFEPTDGFAVPYWFEKCSSTYEYKTGQKVAMVVYNHQKDPECGIGKDFVHKYNGPSQSVAVLCGKITHVGNDHVEYNINTQNGYSGAIVFCIPVGDIGDDEALTAIAVHAGCKSNTANFGIKINSCGKDSWTVLWKKVLRLTKIRCV